MRVQITFTKPAKKDLDALPKDLSLRIQQKLLWYACQDNPLAFAEPLQGPDKFYRFRIGEYRAIFYLEGNRVVIVVVAIKHRRNVYRQLG